MRLISHLAAALMLLMVSSSPALASSYDIVARMLAPILNPFLENPPQPEVAIRGTLVLESAAVGGTAAEPATPPSLRFAVERPDRLRVEGVLGSQSITVCRVGTRAWAQPGAAVRELLSRMPAPRESAQALGPMRLPVNDIQAVFLPALLSVNEVDRSVYRGQKCRVLDLGLMPELARAAGADAWSARVWVREADDRPARLGVRGPNFTGVARVEQLEYVLSLPPETWVAPEGAESISAGRLFQLVSALMAQGRAAQRAGTPRPPAP